MNLVVDTSVIIAVIINEPEKSALIELTQDFELIAPLSVHWEIGNAFSAMLKRQRITLEEATAAVEIYRKIPINFVEADLIQSLELAFRHNIYAYDAYLIACALSHNSQLLTLDKGLIDAAKTAKVSIIEVR